VPSGVLPALVCSKLIPYVFAVALSAWAERLASSVDAGT
jgi:hypothetical protein